MPIPTPQQHLDEALAARHQLLLGKATVSLSFGERRVEYTKAELPALEAYIAELRRTIAGKVMRQITVPGSVPRQPNHRAHTGARSDIDRQRRW
ncbi:gpW family head-tail joining protein [Xanthomonas campestris pv. campestris]|nr:gpW family head-tail joining protein [Xanthomonas campestris pv. campestris]MEB1553122.1 gpW family head-tail joining protein [Xanthomonas campestris pv. campestris]